MKILYVCHRWPYPPKRGGKIRPFNMISHLSQQHDVTVASLVRSDAEAIEGRDLQDHCHSTVQARVSEKLAIARMILQSPMLTPSSMVYFYSRDLAERISTLLVEQHFDLIFVHCSSVAQYVRHVRDIPKIIDFGDMDSQKWRAFAQFKPWPASWIYALEGYKLEREERALAGQFDVATCTTRLELETLQSYDRALVADWFPNGVDHDYFQPGTEYDPDVISFIGRMDYYPNQQCMTEFCRSTLPLVRIRKPNARLMIIGANPSREISNLARLPGVEVTGWVDDVRPLVTQSAVNVAPLEIARGTQNKILEAMAMGVPVVASTLAGKGIDAIAPDHLITADTPEGYADAIVSILDSPDERQRLSASGRARILSHHHWPASLERLDSIIERCVARFEAGQTTSA